MGEHRHDDQRGEDDQRDGRRPGVAGLGSENLCWAIRAATKRRRNDLGALDIEGAWQFYDSKHSLITIVSNNAEDDKGDDDANAPEDPIAMEPFLHTLEQ